MRRDEAAAEAAEEAEEQRMQEVDAQRRLAILRGEVPPPLEDEERVTRVAPGRAEPDVPGAARHKRKWKRPGEDDTDFELRLAEEKTANTDKRVEVARKPTSSAPIVDHAGHIDLFGNGLTRGRPEKNEEAQKEAQKKKRDYEDQFTMRLSNAAGKDGVKAPWYSQSDTAVAEQPPRDVWGNEDPRRRQREVSRTTASDPLAMMKMGASKVRELKKERRKFREERDEELRQLQREERHREKRPRRDDHRSRHQSRSRDRDRERRRSRSREPRAGMDGGHHSERRRRHDDGPSRRRSRSPDRGRRHGRDHE